jgi:hypothetical protein
MRSSWGFSLSSLCYCEDHPQLSQADCYQSLCIPWKYSHTKHYSIINQATPDHQALSLQKQSVTTVKCSKACDLTLRAIGYCGVATHWLTTINSFTNPHNTFNPDTIVVKKITNGRSFISRNPQNISTLEALIFISHKVSSTSHANTCRLPQNDKPRVHHQTNIIAAYNNWHSYIVIHRLLFVSFNVYCVLLTFCDVCVKWRHITPCCSQFVLTVLGDTLTLVARFIVLCVTVPALYAHQASPSVM